MTKVNIPASTYKVLSDTLAALETKAERGGVPPKGAQSAAARGLELRKKFGRGGTMVGVARARDISNGKNLSESTIRRMKAYFDRHEVDKQGKDWDNAERPSNGKIAWLLWGGDAGRSWATKLVERWNREDGKTKSLPRWLPNGEEIRTLKELAAVLCIDEKTAAYVVLDSYKPPRELYRKAARYVRTPAGALRFGQPIGARIVADGISWIKPIWQNVAETGGITFSFLTGGSPTSGFSVASRGNNKEVPDSDFFNMKSGPKMLASWLREKENMFDEPDAFLGLWHDADNGEVVFDVSFVINDREEAIRRGKQNNQQAIWDIANMAEIDTGGTGDRQGKGLSNGNLHGKAAEARKPNERRRVRVVEPSGVGNDDGPSEQEILEEDGDWTGRTGTRHYSLGRVLKPESEEKRQVRDSAYWGAPVGTPLPLPAGFLRSTPSNRDALGIGSHGVVRAARASMDYRKRKGLNTKTRVDYRKVSADKERASRIADFYDELPVDDPAAHEAYDQLAIEIDEQYTFLTEELGVQVEFVDDDPYKNSFEMMDDVENNNRLRVLRTSSTEPHPYLTNEQNDKFRAVHDYFGHAATGRGFAQDGEEAAWISHSLMFGDKARSALTTETRGQNSWYNTRQQGFAVQKVALLPSEFWEVPEDFEYKDVYSGQRGEGVSGGVPAPFETLKPVRRKTRPRIRRIIRKRNDAESCSSCN